MQSLQKSWTLQRSVPLGKTIVSNRTNITPTKHVPTKHPTSTTSTKHQTLTGTTTKPNPNPGYPIGHHGGNSRSGKYILYSGSIRQLEHSQPDKPEIISQCPNTQIIPKNHRRNLDQDFLGYNRNWLASRYRQSKKLCLQKLKRREYSNTANLPKGNTRPDAKHNTDSSTTSRYQSHE